MTARNARRATASRKPRDRGRVQLHDERPYSAPHYYDIAFDVGRKIECDFLEGCFKRHAVGQVRRVLDIACGTGPHLLRLARRGYEMTGLDLSAESLAYVKEQAARSAFDVGLIQADMSDFHVEPPFDAAICLQDSQGHLLTNERILSHLGAVADALRPGGLYIFDRMIPNNWSRPATRWSWTRRRGSTTVRTTFRTMFDIDEVSQVCQEEITLEVLEGARRKIIRQRHPTRVVFPQELRALIQLNERFHLLAWHPNFHLHRRLEDTRHPLMIVAVLRRTYSEGASTAPSEASPQETGCAGQARARKCAGHARLQVGSFNFEPLR